MQTHPDHPTAVYLGPTDDTIIHRASIVDTIATVGPVRLGSLDALELAKNIEGFTKWDTASTQSIERSPAKANRYTSEFARFSVYARTIIAVDILSQHPEVKDPDITYYSIRNTQGLSNPRQALQMAHYIGLNIRSALNRRVGVTTRGYIGLFPGCAQPGDKVCIAAGSDFPLVLRRTIRNPPLIVNGRRKWTFKLVGDADIHQMMTDGKLADNNIKRPEVPIYLL